VGLLDYYKQFEDVDERELNAERRERRRRERALALEQVPEIDLSGTEWPDFPNSEVVNASIYTARGRVNGYPDRHAARVRSALGERLEVEPERIVLGNGAAELLQAAALALLSEGDELAMPWPSYPLYPLMAARAGARPVPVDSFGRLLDAIGERTRALAICNPNDPTGDYLPSTALARLLDALPSHVHLLLDEALVHFQDAEHLNACLRLTDTHDNLTVFRTFSKIYGLSGLRAGYAVGVSTELLDAIAPVLGVNALTQSAVDQALKIGGPEVERRREAVIRERRRLLDALRELPVEAGDSQANFVWLAAQGMSGAELASRLRERGVIVAPGGPLGADDHIRATVRHPAATDRLLEALRSAIGA
jgi:histidinol-phosphate/aromatic aminotransferase/cobyric acid decarboxylase-like protein